MTALTLPISFAISAARKTAAVMRKLSKKIPGPHVRPAFKLVVALLVVVVLLSLVGHHYLSNIASPDSPTRRDVDGLVPDGHNRVLGPNNYPFPGAQHYGTDPVGRRPQVEAYKKEIDELRQIKASVANELRDLESKRLHLQTTIKQYTVSCVCVWGGYI